MVRAEEAIPKRGRKRSRWQYDADDPDGHSSNRSIARCIIEERVAGTNCLEIAAKYKLKSVSEVLSIIRKQIPEYREDMRLVETARCEEMLRLLWPLVMQKNLSAVDRVLAIMDRRAKYWGLNVPDREPDDPREALAKALGVPVSELPDSVTHVTKRERVVTETVTEIRVTGAEDAETPAEATVVEPAALLLLEQPPVDEAPLC